MNEYNTQKLDAELKAAGIQFAACNSNGIVHDLDGLTQIQNRADVAAVIAAHDAAAYTAMLSRIETRRNLSVSEAKLATQLAKLTPAQAETYIQNNVVDLASAKAALKIMARMLIALRDKSMPEAAED